MVKWLITKQPSSHLTIQHLKLDIQEFVTVRHPHLTSPIDGGGQVGVAELLPRLINNLLMMFINEME